MRMLNVRMPGDRVGFPQTARTLGRQDLLEEAEDKQRRGMHCYCNYAV